jgi:hypothetical protein
MVRRPCLNAVVALAALSLCHCASTPPAEGTGSTSTGSSTSTTGSTSGSTASSTGGAIGTGSSGSHGSTGTSSTASSSGGGTGGSYRGIVSFSLVTAPQVGERRTIAAGFGDSQATLQLDLQDCTGGEQVGSCCYRGPTNGSGSTSGSSSGSSSGSTTGAPQAGDIAALDGSTSLGSLVADPTNGRYSTITNQLWAAGDTLSVSAPGDVVGAFSGQVAAPTAVTITAPVGAPPFGVAQVSTSHALVVTWTGVGGTHVYTSLSAVGGGGASGTLICTSDDNGHVTLPSTLLAHFSGAFGGVLLVARSVEAKLPSNNADVTLSAATAVGLGVQFSQ